MTLLSGWCMTNQHDRCPSRLTHCPCECGHPHWKPAADAVNSNHGPESEDERILALRDEEEALPEPAS